MTWKTLAAIVAIAAVPVMAQAQKPMKATKADAMKVAKMISADKAKLKIYCDLAKLSEQMEQADQKKNTKLADELGKKMDDMSEKLGPEYTALMDGMQDIDPNSKEAQDIGAAFEPLDKSCGN